MNRFDRFRAHARALELFSFYQHVFPDGSIRFKYAENATGYVEEILSSSGHQIPSTTALWHVCSVYPLAAKHCFLFNSAAEAISFFLYCRGQRAPGENDKAFVSLGLLPCRKQMEWLRDTHPNAKFHVVFGDDLPGRVMDCKIALWSKGIDARFTVERDYIKISIGRSMFHLPCQEFSLNRFERITGLRAGIRTHKPKGEYSSFLEMLASES